MQPLQEEKDEVPESLDFHQITDPEVRSTAYLLSFLKKVMER